LTPAVIPAMSTVPLSCAALVDVPDVSPAAGVSVMVRGISTWI